MVSGQVWRQNARPQECPRSGLGRTANSPAAHSASIKPPGRSQPPGRSFSGALPAEPRLNHAGSGTEAGHDLFSPSYA